MYKIILTAENDLHLRTQLSLSRHLSIDSTQTDAIIKALHPFREIGSRYIQALKNSAVETPEQMHILKEFGGALLTEVQIHTSQLKDFIKQAKGIDNIDLEKYGISQSQLASFLDTFPEAFDSFQLTGDVYFYNSMPDTRGKYGSKLAQIINNYIALRQNHLNTAALIKNICNNSPDLLHHHNFRQLLNSDVLYSVHFFGGRSLSQG